MSTTKPAHGGHHDEPVGAGGVDPASIAAGHEPDKFEVKPILSIPIAVVLTFILSFSVAAAVFAYIQSVNDATDKAGHQDATARNDAPLNERLEPLKRLVDNDREYTTRPEKPTGNSPQIHPEEVFPDRVPLLQRAEFVNKEKTLARIPIADAMALANATKGFFPVQKAASKVLTTAERPSAASGGAGVVPALPVAPAAKAPEAKAPVTPEPKAAPKAPEAKAPEAKAPEVKAPVTPAPKAPEPKAPVAPPAPKAPVAPEKK